MDFSAPKISQGFCNSCQLVHQLPENQLTRQKAEEIMQSFELQKNIDIFSTIPEERLSTDFLFGEDRGKMFGVLQTIDKDGNEHFLYGFSGQYMGLWHIPGWAAPLFDTEQFKVVNDHIERKIKLMTSHLNNLDPIKHDRSRLILERKRKLLSQNLMKKIHKLYQIHNFKGECKPLSEVFTGKGGIPTGTGDCCAPKLLNHAAQLNLKPLAISEFYWGRKNKSGTKKHRNFYSSCTSKCYPILGFQLCGITNHKRRT